MIDLHTHSTFSDGTFSPAELVDAGIEAGLTAIALTDHDTTNGVGLFLEACAAHEFEGIPGVEISAEFQPGSMHMLGYFMDTENDAFEEMLLRIRGGRSDRNSSILTKLQKQGIDISWADVTAEAGDDVVGRPHFARALLKKGRVRSVKQAFDTYLAKGQPAYADRYRPSPADGVRAITEAGGVAVLGHPATLRVPAKDVRGLVGELVDAGLRGMEIYCTEHNAMHVREYLSIANEFDLLTTGGTDFHGAVNPDIAIGRGFGSLNVPDRILDELYRVAGRSRDAKTKSAKMV